MHRRKGSQEPQKNSDRAWRAKHRLQALQQLGLALGAFVAGREHSARACLARATLHGRMALGVRSPHLIQVCLTLLLLLGACDATLAPVKRTMTLVSPGEYAVSLTFPGLHVEEAEDLLKADAAERQVCPAATVKVVSAKEELSPPKDGAPPDAPPHKSTTISGTIECAGGPR